MIANTVWFAKDLMGKNKRQFQIPVYQRNYDWGISNCKKLFDDILKAYEQDRKHFTGIIVYSKVKSTSTFDLDYIIDGQQRVTTMHILLKALHDYAKKSNNEASLEEIEDYLYNKNSDNEYKLKLKPIKSDNVIYTKIMNGDMEDNLNSNVSRNYKYLHNEIGITLNSGFSIKDILRGIRNLEVVEIILDKTSDDAQEIFESINSTGLDLSIADLIRNFLLMVDENQSELYENYWLPIENLLNSSNLHDFFTDYLTYKLNDPIRNKNTYTKFKEFFIKRGYTSKSMLEELTELSELYANFIGIKSYKDNEINSLLNEIRILKNTTLYPFLFSLFKDYKYAFIDRENIVNVLRFLVKYIFKRIIVGLPNNVYRGIFPSLYEKLKKNTNKSIYDNLLDYFSGVNTGARLPNNDEFKQKLVIENLYQKRNICKYALLKIENEHSKEKIDLENLTIEHILPQDKNNDDWRKEIGNDYENVYNLYLHTLGNLTISGYNSQLGTRPFIQKKEIIKNYSRMTILNKEILEVDQWDENAIIHRAEILSGRLVKIFEIDGFVPVSNKNAFTHFETISLEDDESVTNTSPMYLHIDNQKTSVRSYKMVLDIVMKWLYKKNSDELHQLASIEYITENATKAFVSYNKSIFIKAEEIEGTSIFYDVNLSAKQILIRLRNTLEELGIAYDDILIEIKSNR